jgi:hypothetical protein
MQDDHHAELHAGVFAVGRASEATGSSTYRSTCIWLTG